MRICLYSSMDDPTLFETVGFYRDDIRALQLDGNEVIATNSVRRLLAYNPDVMVGYFYTRSLVPAGLARMKGAKVVLTGGADAISPKLNHGWKLLVRRTTAAACALLASRVVVPCEEDAKNYRAALRLLPWATRRIHRASHVVTYPERLPDRPTRSPARFNAFTLCWMGNRQNVLRKGLDRALLLTAGLRSQGINASLTVAGADGPGRQYWDELVDELDLGGHATYLGRIDDLEKERLFATSDAYVQLSRHEGFGVAAAEAYMRGTPVVHTGKGGLSDAIGDGGIVISDDTSLYTNSEWLSGFQKAYLEFEVNEEAIASRRDRFSLRARYEALLPIQLLRTSR